jgi:hypothetical protein
MPGTERDVTLRFLAAPLTRFYVAEARARLAYRYEQFVKVRVWSR